MLISYLMLFTTRWWFQIYFFQPYLGKYSNLTNIFQMGWNHQLDKYIFKSSTYTPED